MKKHLIAAAALATLSTAAFAQSATVYGILDTSIWKDNNSNQTNQSKTSMESGVWLPSLFGVTGTEDLGGGLKASFKLEGNLNTDTGAAGSSIAGVSDGGLFDRQAWVGLSGSFGELRAGKQIDALFLQSFLNNVRLAHSNSAAVMGALLATSINNNTATNSYIQSSGLFNGGVFSPNTVQYVTPAFNGVKLTLQHQFGEQAGSSSANGATGALLNVDSIQNLKLSAGVKTSKSAGTVASGTTGTGTYMSQSLVGAVYTLGNLQFNVQTNEYKFKQTVAAADVANGDKVKLNEFGVAYTVTPKLVAAVNYVDVDFTTEGTKLKTDVTSLSLKYSLSKRTSLWTMASRTDKTTGAGSATDAGFTPAAPFYLGGAAQDSTKARTGYGVGVTHTF